MLTLADTLKFILRWRQSGSDHVEPGEVARRGQGMQVSSADEERAFVASIAQLPAEERQKRIVKRNWYRQLAERQGVMEAERQAQQNLWK